MRVLLDTHIFLWAVLDPDRLPARTREQLENPATEIVISAVSAWEIATKFRLGRLENAVSVVRDYPKAIAGLGATELPITRVHALKAGSWDVPHRDPFDRMLAAQAAIESLPLASVDEALKQFGIAVL